MTYCSPYNETIKNKKTCYSINSLLKIARSWNKENKSKRKNIKLRKHRTKLWNRINNKIKGKCSNEWCWKEQPFVKELNDSTINNSHRPYKPQEWYKNERTWLNTYDIRNVMKQYQKKHKDFYFIGPVPIDFDYKFSDNNCVSNEICGIDTEELLTKKDKHKIAKKSGSFCFILDWVCLAYMFRCQFNKKLALISFFWLIKKSITLNITSNKWANF